MFRSVLAVQSASYLTFLTLINIKKNTQIGTNYNFSFLLSLIAVAEFLDTRLVLLIAI